MTTTNHPSRQLDYPAWRLSFSEYGELSGLEVPELERDYEPEQAYGSHHDYQEHLRYGGTRDDY